MRTRYVRKVDGRWGLWLREWYGGPDRPDHTLVMHISPDEAVEMVSTGDAIDWDGSVAAMLKNPLDGIAEASA